MTKPAIGFVGAGLMGAGMAGCLLAAGHPLHLLAHRNRDRITPLLERGASEARDIAALCGAAEVIFTCLPDAETVEALAREIVPLLRPGQIWIDTTTSHPDTSARVADRVAGRGAIFADAPVTGGPPQARDGVLSSLVGCEDGAFARIEPLLAPYSAMIRRFGAPGAGTTAKLLNNLVSQGTLVLLADAFQCAARAGVDARALYDVMMTGAARSGTLEKAVAPALDGDYGGSQFTIANAAKDLRYAHGILGRHVPARVAVAAALEDRLARLVDAGRGEDFVSTLLRPDAP